MVNGWCRIFKYGNTRAVEHKKKNKNKGKKKKSRESRNKYSHQIINMLMAYQLIDPLKIEDHHDIVFMAVERF